MNITESRSYNRNSMCMGVLGRMYEFESQFVKNKKERKDKTMPCTCGLVPPKLFNHALNRNPM